MAECPKILEMAEFVKILFQINDINERAEITKNALMNKRI